MSHSYDLRRPSLHFSPSGGWINDPNGLLFDGERYHLFAQHNPDDTVWGPMHWLHAVSGDLLHWEELGIALYPDSLGTAFSGSMVLDERDAAGFGAGAMVAVYTLHGDAERQGLAYSTDGLRFTPYPGNPVIDNPGVPDFRDPKVFWNERAGLWSMALSAGTTLEFYRSQDLRHWEKTGSFGQAEAGRVLECPDLFPLPAPDGREAWVLLCSIGAPAEWGGGRMRYYLGDFDDRTFTPFRGYEQGLALDFGPDDYAGVTYNGLSERIYMGWAANPTYAGKVPALGYRGHMTLPRRLGLISTPAGLRLAAEPVVGGDAFEVVKLSASALTDGQALPQDPYELRVRADGPFEISLENRLGEALRFGLSERGELFMERGRTGDFSFDEWFSAAPFSLATAPRVTEGELTLRLLVDGPLFELYADGGAFVSTMLVFPTERLSTVRARGSVVIAKG